MSAPLYAPANTGNPKSSPSQSKTRCCSDLSVMIPHEVSRWTMTVHAGCAARSLVSIRILFVSHSASLDIRRSVDLVEQQERVRPRILISDVSTWVLGLPLAAI